MVVFVSIKDIVKMMRIKQWYKNIVIFIPIVFAQELFNFDGLFKTVIGLISLCLISSSNYIINDIIDRKNDKLHPEKKNRPLASGKININTAIVWAIFLIAFSLLLAFTLSGLFAVSVISLFVLSLLYSFWLKNELFVDIIIIAINFVIRTVSGTLVILEYGKPWLRISPWLILGTFFLSLFISSGKRKADFELMKNKASAHKYVLGQYNQDIIRMLMIVSTTLLIISYSLYSFLSIYPLLLVTLPVAIYIIFRYFNLVEKNSIIARHPEFFYKDRRLVLSIIILLATILTLVYGSNFLL
tara:strand:- start:689 stop:1588 length:900 start_codon:yes stop_codon:yes gene_type:complete